MGRTLYLLINVINKHLLNTDYVHGNSNRKDAALSLEQFRYSLWIRSVQHRLGTCQNMHILEPQPRSAESETVGWGPSVFFHLSSRWFFRCWLKFKNFCPVGASSLVGEIRYSQRRNINDKLLAKGGAVQEVLNSFSWLDSHDMISHGQHISKTITELFVIPSTLSITTLLSSIRKCIHKKDDQ